MQSATSRTTTYDPNTNAISQSITAGQEFLSDAALKAYSSGFPAGASATAPLSLNTILGDSTVVGGNLVWHMPCMAPCEYLFWRSRRLTCEGSHDPVGRHDVLACIPLVNGIGAVETTFFPHNVMMKCPPDLTLRSLDLQLTDYKGAVVNMRGLPLSFSFISIK